MARTVARTVAGDERVTLEDGAPAWAPEGATAPLVLDLPALFLETLGPDDAA